MNKFGKGLAGLVSAAALMTAAIGGTPAAQAAPQAEPQVAVEPDYAVFQNLTTKLCLEDLPTGLTTGNCYLTFDQGWRFHSFMRGWLLQNVDTTLCLQDVNLQLVAANCDGTNPTQIWTFPKSGPETPFRNMGTLRCLQENPTTVVSVANCTYGEGQVWRKIPMVNPPTKG